MLRDFFGRSAKTPDEVTSQDLHLSLRHRLVR
jgi:hypothetical protein